MHQYYQDILDRIPDPPQWFDENAVPRYVKFAPTELANIHAREAALVLVRCRGCRREFQVAFSEINAVDRSSSCSPSAKGSTIADLILEGRLENGDPPNVRCCAAGPTMGSVPVRVLQYWCKPVIRGIGVAPGPAGRGSRVTDLSALNFKRDPAFEIDLAGS